MRHKRLAAQASTASLVICYTVGSGNVAKIRQITICNRENAANTFRLVSLDNGELAAGVDVEDYMYYDTSIAANSTLTIDYAQALIMPEGMSLAILGSDTNLTIQVWGEEGEAK